MGVPGALQCRIFSPRNGDVSSWSLPVWMIGMCSPSVMMGLQTDGACVVVLASIAQAMNIFYDEVRVKDLTTADMIVHGAVSLGIAQYERFDGPSSSKLGLRSGKVLELPIQEIWAGMRVVKMTGSAVLYFDGDSRSNPRGPAGYGCYIRAVKGTNSFEDTETTALDQAIRWSTQVCWRDFPGHFDSISRLCASAETRNS